LWIRTERVDELYRALNQRQLDRASAVLAGSLPAFPEARFKQGLHDTFYGEREFTIVDPNGYELTFCRSIKGRAIVMTGTAGSARRSAAR
jgi:hypothetical protein